MTKKQRLNELEKIAEQLGIGQNREVECVSCHKKIKLQEAILLTNKGNVSYLCPECNKKLVDGDLTKEQVDDIQKEIDKIRKERDRDIDRTPYIPDIPQYEKYPKYVPDKWTLTPEPFRIPYGTGDMIYSVYENTNKDYTLLKLDPTTKVTGE